MIRCSESHSFVIDSSIEFITCATHILLGGWSFGTQKFKVMSATRYARQTFIYSAIPFLRDRQFDGLDVDWEYPKGNDDKKNFVLLLKGMYV
jgi:chitinase